MRTILGVVLLTGCVTVTAPMKKDPVVEAAPAPAPAATCPTGPVPFTELGNVLGATVEKVCLVGAGEDSYLRLHELVAPREGTVLDAGAIRADIEAMFQQNLLKDVVVIAQPLPSKGVMLTYLVTEHEWVTKVDFTGVKAVRPEEFTEIAHAGVRASPFVLMALTETVKALYAGLGYPQVKMDVSVKSLGGGNAALSLAVDEGAQVKVVTISFEGAKQLSEVELRKVIKTTIGAPYLEEQSERDALAVTTLYYDHGMVNVAVVNTTRALSAPGAVELVFQVKEGDVFRLGKVSLTGFSLGVEKDVLKTIEAKAKSVFSRSALQRDMERLRARAKQQGHVVEITPMTTVDPLKKTIDVAFELQKKATGNLRF